MQPDRSRKPISLYDLVAERLRSYEPEALEALQGRAEKPDPEDRFTALVYERLKCWARSGDEPALYQRCATANARH